MANLLRLRKPHAPAGMIAVACLLWATDSVIRYPAAMKVDHHWLVFAETLVGLVAMLPVVIWKFRWNQLLPKPKDILPILVIGIGGSALGGIFFTEAFGYLGPSTATLFQMIQPAVVVGFAYLFLGERHSGVFFQCALWVILNAIVIGYANFDFGFTLAQGEELTKGIGLSILAMLCWGAATVAGKSLLFRYPPLQVIFYRWVVALALLLPWAILSGGTPPWGEALNPSFFIPLLLPVSAFMAQAKTESRKHNKKTAQI